MLQGHPVMATRRKAPRSAPRAAARAAPRAAPRSAAPSRSRSAPANETGEGSRALWNGSIGFGLVQIAVRLYPRERNSDLAFHQIDRRDGALVGYERVNKSTGKRVDWKDVAKGYEIEKGRYVLLTDEDFQNANVGASQTIEIQDFVRAADIAPEFFDRPYVLVPDKRGAKAYGVLRDTLAKKELAAVGLVVLRTRQHLCSVQPEGELLVLELLRFPHELRSLREAAGSGATAAPKATAKEMALAEQLIERMASKWDPSQYKDRYRDDLLAAIHHKAETGTLEPRHEPEKAAKGQVVDLVALLQKSVDSARTHRKRARS
jgi:DNA end-binding protein Ku